MRDPGWLIIFLIGFTGGVASGTKFILWRISVERRRADAYWSVKKNRVISKA